MHPSPFLLRLPLLLLPLLLTACATQPAPLPLASPLQFVLTVPGNPPDLASTPLTVGTYNLHGLRRPALLQKDLALLPAIQIWAFQELHISPALPATTDSSSALSLAALKQLLALLPPGTWHCAFLPLNLENPTTIEGQAIASRFPLQNIEAWPLNHTGKKSRAALAATLTAHNTSILFINTDHEVDWTRLTHKDRSKQLASLTARIDSSPIPHIILAGDFNTTGDFTNLFNAHLELRQTVALLQSHSLLPATPSASPLITFRSGLLRLQLDHLLLRNLTSPAWGVASTSKGSDHFPLWAQIQLPHPSANR